MTTELTSVSHPSPQGIPAANALDGLRRTASRFFAGILVVMGVFATFLSASWTSNWLMIGVASAGLAAAGVFYALRCPETLPARIAISVALAGNWALVTYATTGIGDGEFVLDGHMLFFTYSALLLAYFCWKSVVTLAGLVVVHHLIFSLIAPVLVWPSATYTWFHLVVHGVLAVTVAGSGIAVATKVTSLFSSSEKSLREAETQSQLTAQARADMTDMIQQLETEFGKVVSSAAKGRFDGQISADFSDPALTRLRDEVNKLVRAVERGVGETRRVIERVAQGDLSDTMHGDFDGDFDALKHGVNTTIRQLSTIVKDIKERNGDLDFQARSLSQSSQQLAARAEEQAAALEETSNSMEQVSDTVRASASHASDSGAIIDQTLEDVEGIMTTVKDSMEAVSEIDESATEIERIIGVIEGIARETNLLALNAAVEAARAGEAGKGFAIVANEVRDLAIRAGQASNEVRSVIDESQQKVTRGVELVRAAESALGGIVEKVSNVASHVHQIVDDSSSQNSSIDQIRETISAVDRITQDNAHTAENTARSVSDLEQQAASMQEAIATFKLDESEQPAADHKAA